jgi:hypothetical protein
MKALRVRIETKHRQGSITKGPGYAYYTELLVKGQPSNIPIHIQANGKGIAPLVIFGGKPHESDSTSIGFTLNVPVKWAGGVPQTRHPGKDNLDVIFFDSELRFSDIQVGLVTRKGRFFLTAQKVFEGWVREEIEGSMCFIPSRPEFAYPGMNYKGIWKEMGEVLSVIARVTSDFIKELGDTPFLTPEPAKWIPAQIPEQQKWQRGTVLFFNAITGTGMILGEDEKLYFVHFSSIIEEEGALVKMLPPMGGVYFRGMTNPSMVRSCKPA